MEGVRNLKTSVTFLAVMLIAVMSVYLYIGAPGLSAVAVRGIVAILIALLALALLLMGQGVF
jgi:hypothetical protein